MTDTTIQQGDQVSWQWSGARPSGEVAEIAKEGELTIESNKGNIIKRNANPEDPAVHVAREGNDVVKRAHELDVEQKANGTNGTTGEAKEEKKDKVAEEKRENKADDKAEAAKPDTTTTNGEAKRGDKRTHEESNGKVEASKEEIKSAANGDKMDVDKKETEEKKDAAVEDKAEEPVQKKQKTVSNATEQNDEDAAKKGGRGRPKNADAVEKKGPAKKKVSKPAATADGQPRRSSRLSKSE